MHRLSNGTQSASVPAPLAADGTPGYPSEGNPATNQLPSEIDYYQAFVIQEEMCGVVEAAEMPLDKSSTSQLLGAIRKLCVQVGTGVGQLKNFVKVGWSGTALLCTVDNTNMGAFAFQNWVMANFTPRSTPHHFTNSNTWVCPAGVTLVQFDIVGGGGAGGAGNGTFSGAGGGGGGRVTGLAAVTPGTSYPIVVGGAGGVQPAGTTGGGGGTSSFAAFGSASGGNGGGSGSPTSAGGVGGQGNIGSGISAIATAGSYGSDGQASAAATGGNTIFGGNGGGSGRGDGGGRAGSGGGLAPVGPGGGGGGGYGGDAPGAVGGNGEVVLWY